MKLFKITNYLVDKIASKHREGLYKQLKTLQNYLVEEGRSNLINELQSVGSFFQFDGDQWHISSPGHVIIGNNVYLGNDIYFDSDGGIVISDNVHISDRVSICTESPSSQNRRSEGMAKKPVFIGKNVWLGMNVSVAPGVNIGKGAKIGMNTHVRKDIEENAHINMGDGSFLSEVQEKSEDKRFNPTYLELPSENFCFVLSTGRCGSKSMANNLDKHPDISGQHENIKQLIRLSTQYAHGSVDEAELKKEILQIFRTKTFPERNSLLIHSDQRLWNMVPIFKEIFPDAKFVHLIRDGRDTVRSMYARQWFVDDDRKIHRHQWAEYRLNGHKVGDVDREIWQAWGSFERCCWYWSYINESIDNQLENQTNSIRIKIEEMNNDLVQLLDFLNVDKREFDFKKYNSVSKRNLKKYKFQWDKKNEQLFQQIAGKTQKKFYPAH